MDRRESYQVLNRELIIKVRDLRNENYQLRNTLRAVMKENLELKDKQSDVKQKTLQKFTQISEIMQNFAVELYSGPTGNEVQEEISKLRYSLSRNVTPLSTCSPEKIPGKPAVFVNARSRNVVKKLTDEVLPEASGVDGLMDMSLEDVQVWLNSDDIEGKATDEIPPITEEAQQEEKIEEAQQEEKIEEAQQEEKIEEAQQEEKIEEAQPACQDGEMLYKNMSTIAEESTQISSIGTSPSSHSLLHVTKFASSTPHCGQKAPNQVTSLAVSPILFNGCTNSAPTLRKSPIGAVSDFSNAPSCSTICQKDPEELPKVTTRRGKNFMKDFCFEGFEEESNVVSTKEVHPTLESSSEPSSTDENHGRTKVTVRRGNRAGRNVVNYEEKDELEAELEENKKEDQEAGEVEENQGGESENAGQKTDEEPKKITMRQKPRAVKNPSPEVQKTAENEGDRNENLRDDSKAPETDEEVTVARGKRSKKTPVVRQRTKLGDRTNLTESPAECPRPIKVETFEDIMEPLRPKRRAAPSNLAEPRLGTKLRRT
ncbi:neurofilament medium polypeptide-like [Lutzomyia longipalpis]|uniref:neurofilament medium polypeptide-like n=1 Tax=Lutzomyia longipalpis TaxID=7200 RepID=UPI0024838193|nr:neurofilament medium polypeptide-like [Lutzomyia longipalpis]